MKTPIRVLIVDDSAPVRKLFSSLLSQDSDFEIVGQAEDPFVARDMLLQFRPDVVTLDIEMPKMDGLTFLAKIMTYLPTRTIVCSSLSAAGSDVAYRALELGAIDVLEKPKFANEGQIKEFGELFRERVRAVASAKFASREKAAPLPKVALDQNFDPKQILAIASSTGGTEALKELLPSFPARLPGTVIVQHMPKQFTAKFAEALQRIVPFEVREARDGDPVTPGRVLIAPGDYHMEIAKFGVGFKVKLHQQPSLNGVRPAADFLFRSVAKYAGADAVGVILTGMGRDGAAGLLEMKNAGARTFAQDEASCVVFGMPKEAIRMGAVDKVLPLNQLAAPVLNSFKSLKKVG